MKSETEIYKESKFQFYHLRSGFTTKLIPSTLVSLLYIYISAYTILSYLLNRTSLWWTTNPVLNIRVVTGPLNTAQRIGSRLVKKKKHPILSMFLPAESFPTCEVNLLWSLWFFPLFYQIFCLLSCVSETACDFCSAKGFVSSIGSDWVTVLSYIIAASR